ncbi:MAG: ABC transporter ATP-binding protein [Ferruginibacter sp.]
MKGIIMHISLNNVGKRFNREWIFRHCNYEFAAGKTYAITGSNGSGKSTLLQVISGSLTHNEGTIKCTDSAAGYLMLDNKADQSSIQHPTSSIPQPVSEAEIYQRIAIAAPYLELVEEMSAKEMLDFHAGFKQLVLPITEILQIVGLEKAIHKQIRYYSSGMKQRLKLAQAFFSNTPVLLLDEPTTNLDADGIALYHKLIDNYTAGKLVIVSSNDTQEYDFCGEVIKIGDYK